MLEDSLQSMEEEEEEDGFNDLNKNDKNFIKFKGLINDAIVKKNTKEWKEYLDVYKKSVKENIAFYNKLKTIFHRESGFVIISKTVVRIFHIFFVFIFFIYYFFFVVVNIETSSYLPKRIKIIYYAINFMLLIDLILNILLIIFNRGSIRKYILLPIRAFACIPFDLKKDNKFFILPKFVKVDIFRKIFTSWEKYLKHGINLYISDYHLQIFLICIIKLIKYLLIFILYAHINCCILAYFLDLDYSSSLYYTIEAFTVMGFGELSPKGLESFILVILNLFIGIYLFSSMSSSIKDLSDKIYSFNRDTSLTNNLKFLLFHIQKSVRKALPSELEKLVKSFQFFRRKLSFNDIKKEHKNVFDVCKNNLLDKIRKKSFEKLRLEYIIFFPECTDDFLYDIFENLKPKVFKSGQILVKYGKKVEKIYFLLKGQIYATNKNDKPIFTMINNSIFGDYEFITNTLSLFNIKVDVNRLSYGYVLDKKSWEKISKAHILSTDKFIKYVINKRKKHFQWMISNNDDVNSVKYNNYSNSEKNIEDDNNIINNQSLKNNLNNKDKKFFFDSAIMDKNPKYNYSNISIIRNIDELQRDINKIELNFIDNKNKILKNIKYKCL